MRDCKYGAFRWKRRKWNNLDIYWPSGICWGRGRLGFYADGNVVLAQRRRLLVRRRRRRRGFRGVHHCARVRCHQVRWWWRRLCQRIWYWLWQRGRRRRLPGHRAHCHSPGAHQPFAVTFCSCGLRFASLRLHSRTSLAASAAASPFAATSALTTAEPSGDASNVLQQLVDQRHWLRKRRIQHCRLERLLCALEVR